MTLSEINWDPSAAGSWPLPIKIVSGLVLCAIFAFAVLYFDTKEQNLELEKLEKKEEGFRRTFANKQKKAVNLEDYKVQLKQMEESLGEMLKQLPTKSEVATLLVDISQTGLASGLEFRLFKPKGEIKKEIYSELPIQIEVIGTYEEFGLFASGLASLSRIVTVHNVKINPLKKGTDLMRMTALLKTYNEGNTAKVGKKGKKSKKRRRK